VDGVGPEQDAEGKMKDGKRTFRLEGWIYVVAKEVHAENANEAKRRMISALEMGRAHFIPTSEENLNGYFEDIIATEEPSHA
jgi:2-hydroxychromene-2-carboxylate isomerase